MLFSVAFLIHFLFFFNFNLIINSRLVYDTKITLFYFRQFFTFLFAHFPSDSKINKTVSERAKTERNKKEEKFK